MSRVRLSNWIVLQDIKAISVTPYAGAALAIPFVHHRQSPKISWRYNDIVLTALEQSFTAIGEGRLAHTPVCKLLFEG